MNKKAVLFVCTFFMSVLHISCLNRPGNEDKEPNNLYAKTITFPSTLKKIDGTKFYEIDSFLSEINEKAKVISIIDGACMKCVVNQLNEIDSIFYSIIPDDNNVLVFILNVNREDSVFFMRNLQPAINAKGIILWDSNYYFERTNDLFTPDINLRTFMVNNKNQIIQYGNPLINNKVIFEYCEKIEMNI